MGTAANVLVGATGQVNFAPTATPVPTTAVAVLNGAFTDLGYCSDAGVEEDHAQTNKPVKRWGGQTVRNLLTEQTDTYKMVFLETNPDVLEAYHGPQTDPSTVVEVTIQQGQRGAWVIDALDGDNIIRHVISDGQVSNLDPIKYAADDAVTYGVTITAYPDVDGITVKKYVVDASVS